MGTSTANNRNQGIFTNSTRTVESQQNSIIHRATLIYFALLTAMVSSLLFAPSQLLTREIRTTPGKIKISLGIGIQNGDFIFFIIKYE